MKKTGRTNEEDEKEGKQTYRRRQVTGRTNRHQTYIEEDWRQEGQKIDTQKKTGDRREKETSRLRQGTGRKKRQKIL